MAIEKFDELKSKSSAYEEKNMEIRLSGLEILELYKSDKKFWIGRNRGIDSPEFGKDLKSGGWKTFLYQVNRSNKPDNKNWFSAEEFVKEIENYKSQPEVFRTHPLENEEVEKKEDKIEDPWAFHHLGEEYFMKIAKIVCGARSLDVPIDTVYIGCKGEEYIKKRYGRNVNPKWCVIMNDEKKYKYDTQSHKLEENKLWELKNCKRFDWQEIRNYYKNN